MLFERASKRKNNLMNPEVKIIKAKLRLLESSRQPGNKTQPYKVLGCFRGNIYRFKKLYEDCAGLSVC